MLTVGGPVIWLRQRELNCFPRSCFADDEMKNFLYRNLSPVGQKLPNDCLTERCGHGGIFGMGFSPDGSILGAACEKKSLLLIDPLSRRMIKNVERVHTDCVNSIKFLDGRLFATCSDDHTVKLWDLRLIKDQQPIRVFRGHSNWVKNIEYIADAGVLLTSGFDNTVLAWEINRYTESSSETYTRLFYTPGLIRMCLTKDLSKMIISTQWGYLFVVHNFDPATCPTDLQDFKPNVCWLMMKSATMTPADVREVYLRRFEASRNRAELIIDFPEDNDPENITSIAPHPHGWCVLSRNLNSAENTEWTCVHDIQLPPVDELMRDLDLADGDGSPSSLDDPLAACRDQDPDRGGEHAASELGVRLDCTESALTSLHRHGESRRAQRRTVPVPMGGGRVRSTTDLQRLAQLGAIYLGDREESISDVDNLVPRTYRRLTHYIEEPNVGRGFIKEQSFSSDGRLIASPFGFGVRLLAFDEKCSELSQVSPLRDCEPSFWPVTSKRTTAKQPTRTYETRSRTREMEKDREAERPSAIKERKKKPEDVEPLKLWEVSLHVPHTSPVLCAQFSPTHCLLASGCYNGKVAFYQPVL